MDGGIDHKVRGWGRLGPATRFALQGLAAAWRHEAAFRLEVAVLGVAVLLAWWLGGTAVEQVLLVGSVVLVCIVELLNSAIEAVVDRHGPEHHPLAGRAKDLGAAAVFVSVMLAALTWGLLLAGRG
jgi:diacylglycerol kinase (ATP)